MGYNKENDKMIKLFEMEQENGSLQFIIFSYNEAEPKLQITRTYNKKDGTIGYGSSGRLSKNEILFLVDKTDEIIKLMNPIS